MQLVARRVLLVMSTLLVFGGVSGVQTIQQGPSAQSVLHDARAFVTRHPGFRFTGTIAFKTTELANTVAIAGELESARRGHVVVSYAADEGVREIVVLDDVNYTRSAETTAALANTKYDKSEAQARAARRGGVSRREDIDVAAWLDAAHHPKRTRHHGELTGITTDVNVTKLYGADEARQIDWMTLRMTVHRSGEIRSLVQVTRDGRAGTSTVTLRFTDWGTNVAVAPPPADQVDPTPAIDEEGIAAFTESALYMPKTLPKGWKLVRAVVLAEGETVEGCAQVELEFGVLDGPDSGGLTLYEFPNSCSQPLDGEGVAPFTAGRYRGFGRSSEAEGTVVQITVGITTLQATTHELTLQELAAVLKDLVPLKV
jgi:hypothetical protein